MPAEAGTDSLHPQERGFVNSTPAATWEEGLLCGNGTIGASVLGRPLDEVVVFSHEDIWMPKPTSAVPPKETAEGVLAMRALAEQGQYAAARKKGFEVSGAEGHMYPDSFVPAFDLRMDTETRGEVRDYYRSLDFATGVATVGWRDDRGAWRRRFFVSRADGVAAIHQHAPVGAKIACRLRLAVREPSPRERPGQYKGGLEAIKERLCDVRIAADEEWLTFSCDFVDSYPGGVYSVNGVARVMAPGATTEVEGDSLVITGGAEVLVLLIPAPVLEKSPVLDELKKRLQNLPADFDRLLSRHAALHSDMFTRMRLDLGGNGKEQLTSEELLEGSTPGITSPALLETVFDAGRYNIISSCGKLPPTLQGVWAGTYCPFWSGGYTNDGNLPSAIAGLLRWNTPELMKSYTGYIESLLPHFRLNAKKRFGCRGFQIPVCTANAGYNLLPLGWGGGFWAAGSAWAAHFFYDYYLYTGDREFLAEHAMPFMEEAALFFEDFLYEGPDGKYRFNPSYSPENTPANSDGGPVAINATMDVMAVKELITHLIEGSRLLGINADKIPAWEVMLTKLPGYLLSPDGFVKEWCCDVLDEQRDHRHTSQLYELYDGLPESIENDPALWAGFRRIIETKLEHHYKEAGFMAFGIVQLGLAAASLGERALAYRCVSLLANSYWLNNMASTHNVGWAFNMDISGGLPAIVLMMLVDSRPGAIRLLPALPKEWPTGMLKGALCRGQIEIEELAWQPGCVRATLRSGKEQPLSLSVPWDIAAATLDGRSIDGVSGNGGKSRGITVPRDESVTLEITFKDACND